MGGMSQVAGEFAVGIGMARFTRFNDVVSAQGRGRITDRKNFMRTMAIRAFGCNVGSQLRDFAMIGVEIGLGDLWMAIAALTQYLCAKVGAINPVDLMRFVAAVTRRQFLICVAYQGTVNRFFEIFKDAQMAGTAGRANVFGIYAGIFRFGGKYLVRPVAIGANG